MMVFRLYNSLIVGEVDVLCQLGALTSEDISF